MGLAVLGQSLHQAAMIHSKSSREAVQAYAFISGSGLEMTIEKFGLDMNADELRSKFKYVTRKRDTQR